MLFFLNQRKTFSNLNLIESKLIKDKIFIMINVNVINEKTLVEDIAITLDELFSKKNWQDLIDVLETLNLYKTDMSNKSKRMGKTVEKFYLEFIDNQ